MLAPGIGWRRLWREIFRKGRGRCFFLASGFYLEMTRRSRRQVDEVKAGWIDLGHGLEIYAVERGVMFAIADYMLFSILS